MTAEIKIIAILAAVIGLVLAGWFGYRSAFDSGDTAGAARVQTAWDIDKAQISALSAKALADVTKERDDALVANEGIQRDYQAQLSAAVARSDEFIQRLRDAETRASADRGTLSTSNGGHGSSNAASVASGQAQIDASLGAYDTACQHDAAQLNALIAQLRPQL